MCLTIRFLPLCVITVFRTENVALAVKRPASGAPSDSVIAPPEATLVRPKVNRFDGDGVGVGVGVTVVVVVVVGGAVPAVVNC